MHPILEQAFGRLVDRKQFYTPLISRTRVIEEYEHRVGIRWASDRLELFVNIPYFQSISPAQRVGTLEHEYAHFILRHLSGTRSLKLYVLANALFPGFKDIHSIINVAMDLEINETIVPKHELDPDNQFPSDHQFPSGLLAEEYLRLLAGKLQPIDVEKIIRDVMAGDFIDEVGEVILKGILDECYVRGSAPGGLDRVLEKLRPPQLTWPNEFSSSILSVVHGNQQVPTWSRPNRRGLPMAGRTFKDRPDCYVLQDSSGSMSPKELAITSSEIFGLRKYFREVHVLVCDAKVQARYIFRGTIESVKGGGGSDFCPAFEVIESEFRIVEPVVILLTDGHITVPAEQPFNHIFWVLTSKASVPYGKPIYIR